MRGVSLAPAIKAQALSSTLSANFSTASTSYVTTGCVASMRANAGELIMCTVSMLWNNEGVQSRADVQTLVAGTPVNSLAAAGLTGSGSDGLLGRSGFIGTPVSTLMYIMQPNDDDGGRITCDLRMKCDSAATKTLIANSASFTFIHLTNFGYVGDRFSKVTLTGGAIGALTNTTYSSATPSVTVPADPGDLLIVGGDFLWFSEAFNGYTDVLVTSGAGTNYVSGLTSSDVGISAWTGLSTAIINCGTPIPYSVQTNDITAGAVTLALQNKISSAGTKNFIGTNPKFWVLNLGARAAAG